MINCNQWKKKTIFVVLISLFSIQLCLLPSVSAEQGVNFDTIHIRVYNGGLDQKNVASETALFHMFQWMGANVEWIDAEDILNGGLNDIDILAMPAISPYTINSESTAAGGEVYEVRTMIQDYIHEGGAYFGIYGGHYFEWSGYTLFDVRLTFPNPNVSTSEDIAEININTDLSGPDLTNHNETMSMLSWNPGYFVSFGDTRFITIATYPENGLPAMVCFNLGGGRVFISSPHPENEENSDRDGTSFYDYLEDPDSEWEFLRSITIWLVNKTHITIFWATTGIFGGFIIIILLYMKISKR